MSMQTSIGVNQSLGRRAFKLQDARSRASAHSNVGLRKQNVA